MKGLIQVYTGNGKGKTTASLGLVLRAVGKGRRAIIIQFMKGKIDYGELESIKHVPNATIEQYGRPDFVDRENPAKIDIDLALKGFERAREVILSGKYDIVVLDELNIAMNYGLIEESDVLKLLNKKPDSVELILTGRYAPPSIIDIAALVTVMTEVKHPFMKGIECREGIDY